MSKASSGLRISSPAPSPFQTSPATASATSIPLISQGQSAILGVGGELDGAGNETLYLTLAFDHQLAKGCKAAQFVRELAGRLEAHAALEPAPVQEAPAAGEPYCALCQRDREALRLIRGILVRSEIPAGFVCSVCLAELS